MSRNSLLSFNNKYFAAILFLGAAVFVSSAQPLFANEVSELNNQGVRALLKKDSKSAQTFFLKALALDPHYEIGKTNLGISYNNLALDCFRDHNPQAALSMLYKATLLDPSNAITAKNVDQIVSKLKMDTKSSKDREKLGDYWFATGAYLNALAEYERAEGSQSLEEVRQKIFKAYKEAKIDEPELVKIHEVWYPKLTTIVKSEEAQQKNTTGEPSSSDFWSKLDRLAIKADYKELESALNEYFQKHTTKDKDYFRALQRRARTYWHLGEWEKAAADAIQVIAQDKKSVDAYDALAEIQTSQNEPEKAVACLSKAIEINKNIPKLYTKRAHQYRRLKMMVEAKSDGETAKSLAAAPPAQLYIPDGEPGFAIDTSFWTDLTNIIPAQIWKKNILSKTDTLKNLPSKDYKTVVAFRVDYDGRVSEVKLSQPSGEAVLDQIALDAFKNCPKLVPHVCGLAPPVYVHLTFTINPAKFKPAPTQKS